ncbi:hypothetical protein [Wolbachia endosymbiont of Folsomia candida]|uniref:hypothetical protein n=1 Tax=Wolbachia endosymbiont of Folsomia candida TaxID=169402 RepID=UPI000B5E98C2|nr:hypothetical protein [Wolbachia endosymbiont of Folsomia candida]
MFDNYTASMFTHSNGQEKLSSSEEEGLQEGRVQFAESNQLSGDNSEYDWYNWIDHLISLEPNKAIEKLEADISELEEELIQLKDEWWLKSDIEIDLKLIKCLAQHFHNPEKIIKELKHYTENKPKNSVNRINGHIILVKYFAEKTQIEITQEIDDFIEGIEIKYKKKSRTKSSRKTNPESPYAALDEKTAKQNTKEEYSDKLEALRNLIIYAKNNFDNDTYIKLLIGINNCIVGSYLYSINQETLDHVKDLRACVEALLRINHGNFEQILCDIKDLMEPVLKQSNTVKLPQDQTETEPATEEAQNPLVSTPGECLQNGAKITAEKVDSHLNPTANQVVSRGIHIMYTDPWYYNIDMAFIKRKNINVKIEEDDEYAIIKFLDNIQDDKERLNLALSALFDRKDDMDHELQSRITSRFDLYDGTQKSTTTTATEYYEQPQPKAPIPNPAVPLCDNRGQTQNESEQPKQIAQSVDNTPKKSIPPSNPQTTHHRPQSKSNVYDNKSFSKEIMGVVGAIVGTIIGATIAYFAGAATLPIIAAIAVFSTVAGALIGYGIAEICEKVSREKQNDPKMDTLTALREVHTTELLTDSVDVAI